MLVENNVLCTKGFTHNLSSSSTLIHSCDVNININARQHFKFWRYKALASALIIILPCSKALVAFQHIRLPDSCNFLFCPSSQQHLTLYSHLLNHNSIKVLVRNNADHAIKIPLHYRLGCITELPYKSCFATSVDFDLASTSSTSLTIFHDHNDISILSVKDLETELPNSIKIYRDKKVVNTIMYLVDKYPSIWKSSDFVQILPKR